MNRKQLLERLTKNWPQKAVCLVLASTIYFFNQMQSMDHREMTIPLEVKSDGPVLSSAGGLNSRYIKISVRTKKENSATLQSSDFKAYVNLDNETREGTFSYPVVIELSERARLMDPLEIVAKPDSIMVSVEQKAMKSVPLKTSKIGEPAYGFKCSTITCEPFYITVIGPRSMISELASIPTSSLLVEGAKTSFSGTVKPLLPNSYLKIIDEQPVTVTAVIVPEGMIKKLSDLAVTFENLKDDFEIKSKEYRASITVEGNLLDIERVTASTPRVYCDCSFITEAGEYEIPVKVDVPGSLHITETNLETVSFSVVRKTAENTENEEDSSEPEAIMPDTDGEEQ